MIVEYRTNRLDRPSLRADRLTEPLLPFDALDAVKAGPGDRDRLPEIDLSVVTYRSAEDLGPFFDSLVAQDYPLDRINLLLMRHAPCAEEERVIEAFAAAHGGRLRSLRTECRENRGFGAGHNANFGKGGARYFVVSNADVVLFGDTLTRLVRFAEAASRDCAAVEARQFPFNHPKFYNPATFETSWLVCCLALFARSAYAAVDGFDEHLFMYGEDVDLSLRLRERGYRIAFNPYAQVGHTVLRQRDRTLMFRGGFEATWLIRLSRNPLNVFHLLHPRNLRSLAGYLRLTGGRTGSRRLVATGRRAWARYRARRRGEALRVPSTVNGFEFEWRRPFSVDLADLAEKEARGRLTDIRITVSILIRVTAGRGASFEFALRTALAQTYPAVEVVVLEDGSTEMADVVRRYRAAGHAIRYIAVGKVGRSHACNLLLAAARGTHCLFLDDDDYLLLEHVETLVDDGIGRDGSFGAAWAVSVLVKRRAAGFEDRTYVLPDWYETDFDPATMRLVNYFPIQSLLFSHRDALAAGRINVDLPYLEDWNFFAKITAGGRGNVVKQVTSVFRLPGGRADRRRRAKLHYSAYHRARADIEAYLDAAGARKPAAQRTIRLLYHRIGESAEDPFALDVAPDRFRRHLETIANRADKSIVARDGVPCGQAEGAPLAVEIHFDDAYADITPYVRACLEFGLPVRVFATGYSFDADRLLPADAYLLALRRDFEATTDASRRAANGAAQAMPRRDAPVRDWYRFFGDLWKEEPSAARAIFDAVRDLGRPAEEGDLLLMSPGELRSLTADGCLVGSHGAGHVRLAGRPRDLVADDAARIGDLVAQVDAAGARHFAFPFGGAADIDAAAAEALDDAGFEHLYSCLGKDTRFGGIPVLGRFQVGNLDALNFAECFDRLASAMLAGDNLDAIQPNHFLHEVVHVAEDSGW